MNLAAIGLCDSSTTGDYPAACTGVSLYVTGARCEFVTIDSIPAELGGQCLFELIYRDEGHADG